MKNRISLVLDPQDVADYKAAQATQKRLLLKWLVNADLKEVTAGNYMGTEGGWMYCKDGYAFALACPKVYDEERMSIEEYSKDINGATFFIDANKDSVTNNDLSDAALILLGKDLMEQTHHVRKQGNEKKDVNLTYAEHSAKLNTLYDKRNAKAEETRKANELIKDLQTQIALAQNPPK